MHISLQHTGWFECGRQRPMFDAFPRRPRACLGGPAGIHNSMAKSFYDATESAETGRAKNSLSNAHRTKAFRVAKGQAPGSPRNAALMRLVRQLAPSLQGKACA